MFKTILRRAAFIVTAAALAFGAMAAQAATIYTFDTSSIAGYGAGPYGTVTLTQNGTSVDVTVTLRSDLDFVVTGGPHSIFAFQLAGATTGDITNVAFASGSNGTIGVVANNDATPYGTFYLTIDCTAGCVNGAPGKLGDPLTFTVLNATVADFANVNSLGYYFAADVICSDRKTVGSCNGLTGSIAVKGGPNTDTDVPEPGTLALLGLGLIGLGAARRRKG